MNEFRWDIFKNESLKRERGVSFEEMLQAPLIGERRHPARKHQTILLFEYQGYIWVVPCVAQGEDIFLKTMFPSRKYTKMWKRGEIP